MIRLLMLSIFICLLVFCADPFSSRTSQPPVSNQGTFVQPVSPQIVLFNLENSYKEQVIINFLLCLDTAFFFKYDFVIKQFDERDSGWYYNDESRLTENMFNNLLLNSNSTISLSINTLAEQQDEIFDTTAVLYRSYNLKIKTENPGEEADSVSYPGTAIFTLIENRQGLWRISRWEDRHQNTNIQSWADFKNIYR